ncbi:MAG: hypothetical protein ACI9JM_001031 [Halioglobus sp.]|jgi:hypothetical protein
MSASGIRWGVIALLYAAFHLWYGGSGSPLTDDEVDYYVERATDMFGPDAEQPFRKFASTDDGNEFVNVNLNKYRDKPKYRDGREADETSEEIEGRYLSKIAPDLTMQAAHPLIVVKPIVVLGGEADIERTAWDSVTFIRYRYRSRGDFLEFILESDWNENV